MDRAGRSSDMLGQYHLLQVFFWVVLDAQQFTWLQQPQLLTLQINQTFTKVHAYLDGIIHVHGCLSENPHVWWLNIQLLIVNCPCLMAISSQFMVKSRYLKAHPNVDSYIPILYEKQHLFWCRKIIEQNPNDYDATNLFDVFFFAFAHVKINLFVEIMVSNVYDQPFHYEATQWLCLFFVERSMDFSPPASFSAVSPAPTVFVSWTLRLLAPGQNFWQLG